MSGVYISYPFCNQKCSFCNFSSDVGTADMRSRYESVLVKEIARHSWQWTPETLYFGGGTPSLIEPEVLEQIIRAIPRNKLGEATMECAPGTATSDQIEGWNACGINRVSLGVQSFNERELRQTGRSHTAAIVQQEVALLRDKGITNINLDLIAGLPHQTASSWRESLDWIARLDAPHVSVYLFETDEESRLGKELILGGARYGAGSVPSDDIAAGFYEIAVEWLLALGYERYEISNFAKPGARSRHNLKYWLLEPYMGFGLDAHSFDGRIRRSNPDQMVEYLSGKTAGETSDANLMEERFFVGLRLMDGIQPTPAERAHFRGPIERFLSNGILIEDGERLRLSSQGVLLSNELFQEFIGV